MDNVQCLNAIYCSFFYFLFLYFYLFLYLWGKIKEPKQMKTLRFLFVACLLALAFLVNAYAQRGADQFGAADSLLTLFDRASGGGNYQSANAFFALLDREGLTDSLVTFPASTPKQTLQQQVWYWAAEFFYDKQDYTKARDYGLKALPLCQAGTDRTLEGDCLSILSLIYVRQGDFTEAARYAKLCNEIDLAGGDADVISSSFNTLAGIYMSARQPKEAEKYILKAIDYSRQADNPQRRAVLFGMASEIYHQLGKDETALDYATQAYDIDREGGRPDKVAMRQAQRASALISLRRFVDATEALSEAIPGLRASGNSHSLGIALNQMGLLQHGEGNDSAAVRYLGEALEIFTRQHDLYNESHTRKGLYEALRASDPQAAMAHIDRYNELKDSLYDHETGELLSQYAAHYGYDELQKQTQAALSQRGRYIIIGIVALALMVAAVVFLLWNDRRRQRHIQWLMQEISLLKEYTESTETVEDTEKTGVESTEDTEKTEGTEDGTKLEADDGVRPQDKGIINVNGLDSDDRLFLQSVVQKVNEGFLRGQFDTASIAAQFNMSKSTFQRRIQGITGDTPKALFSAIQMHKATTLLTEAPDMPISEVARSCGFEETSNFSRAFKRAFGVTPSQYNKYLDTNRN